MLTILFIAAVIYLSFKSRVIAEPDTEVCFIDSKGRLVNYEMLHLYDDLLTYISMCNTGEKLASCCELLDEFKLQYGKNELYDELYAEYLSVQVSMYL